MGKTISRPGYEYLVVYMLGKAIQDLTIEFCHNYISSLRQKEQMEQAARSNPQNIAEGYTHVSLSSYIHLVGVARGSNEELAIDYEDFLRQRKLEIWGKEDVRVREFRGFRVFWLPNSPTSLNTPNLPKDPEKSANMLLTFCQMEGYLLAKHITSLEEKHRKEGGYKENLLKKRLEYRQRHG
jgi:four helix bundle suffix protein